MKKKNLSLSKKLHLNKEMVGDLNPTELSKVVGGGSVDTVGACCIQSRGGVNTCFCADTQNGAVTCAIGCIQTQVAACTISH